MSLSKRKVAAGAVILALLVVLIVGGAVVLWNDSMTTPDVDCEGTNVPPNADLQQLMERHGEGTTFCLSEGSYAVSDDLRPSEGTQLVGAGMSKTFLQGTGAQIIIDAQRSADVLVAHMDISGAMGTSECKPSCGSGFRGGPDNTLMFVRLHDNVNHGVGGSEPGLLVEDSILDNNGSELFMGCCAGGIKGGNGFTIRDSEVYGNIGNGIWCDSGCPGGLEAVNNAIHDNLLSGIRHEVSDGGAIIRGNTIENNDTSGEPGAHAGIAIIASSDVVIDNNFIRENNGHAIVVRDNPRGLSEDVIIEANELEGGTIDGCGDRVACLDNP